MANENVSQSGSHPNTQNITINPGIQNSATGDQPPKTQTSQSGDPVVTTPSSPIQEVAPEILDEEYYPLGSGSIRTKGKYLKKFQRFDKRDPRIQPGEFWRYNDKDYSENGRL